MAPADFENRLRVKVADVHRFIVRFGQGFENHVISTPIEDLIIQQLSRFATKSFHDCVKWIFANFTKQLAPNVRVDFWCFSLLFLAFKPLLQARESYPFDPSSTGARIDQLMRGGVVLR